MSNSQRLKARQVGHHFGKQYHHSNFQQFVKFLRSIDSFSVEEFPSDMVKVAWISVQKELKKFNQMEVAI